MSAHRKSRSNPVRAQQRLYTHLRTVHGYSARALAGYKTLAELEAVHAADHAPETGR